MDVGPFIAYWVTVFETVFCGLYVFITDSAK